MNDLIQIVDIFGESKNVKIPRTPTYGQGDFLAVIDGHGMEPDFPDESIVIASRNQRVENGDVGIFIKEGKMLIKELGKNELICRNKDFPNIRMNKSDNVLCLGKVIGICNKNDIIF